jgi:hypothetical protein
MKLLYICNTDFAGSILILKSDNTTRVLLEYHAEKVLYSFRKGCLCSNKQILDPEAL